MKLSCLRIIVPFLSLHSVAYGTSVQEPLILQSSHDTDPTNAAGNYWKFNFTSAAPHYFASLYGLLQQWPQTFFPNGHSIVLGHIPAFTKLYHGRMDGDLPPSPEWVAFDIGMSYGIMGGSRNSHMLTYQTTRQVKCLYFDGESATLSGTGQLDTQMLHIFGNVSGPPLPDRRGLFDEYARATGLCDWVRQKKLGGSGWGVEGIIRMNAGFEMIWCNFSSSSVRLVSHLNVTAPQLPSKPSSLKPSDTPLEKMDGTPTSYYPLPPPSTRSDRATSPTNPPLPPNWRWDWDREPFSSSQAWNWFTSSTSHYGSHGGGPGRGEVRVSPLGCGYLSYYSPKFTSQALATAEDDRKRLNLSSEGYWNDPGSRSRSIDLKQLMRRRRAHTLGDVSTRDAAIMVADSERMLRDLINGTSYCSGMDWTQVSNEIVQDYAPTLQTFLMSLRKFDTTRSDNATDMKDWMISARDQSHTFLIPFIGYPSNASHETHYDRRSKLFQETYSRCRFHHTRLLDPNEGVVLGPEEIMLKWAVEETMSGICNVIVDIGLSIEGQWQARFNRPSNTSLSSTIKSLKQEVPRWTQGVEELMAWLGWAGEWTYCERKCEWDERCFIPMWPLINLGFPWGRPPPPGYGRPGYGRPGYGYPHNGVPGHGEPPHRDPPSNDTDGKRPRRPGWQPDETTLWQPICVKSNYLSR